MTSPNPSLWLTPLASIRHRGAATPLSPILEQRGHCPSKALAPVSKSGKIQRWNIKTTGFAVKSGVVGSVKIFITKATKKIGVKETWLLYPKCRVKKMG